jgi:hypothetical protein
LVEVEQYPLSKNTINNDFWKETKKKKNTAKIDAQKYEK